MAEDIDAEYDAFLSRNAAEGPVYSVRKPTYRQRWSEAKLIHVLIAIALAGFVLPLAILFFGIGALGILSAIMGR